MLLAARKLTFLSATRHWIATNSVYRYIVRFPRHAKPEQHDLVDPVSDKPAVAEAIRLLISRPGEYLLHRWNWKAALFSSLCRAGIFYQTNISYGSEAAVGAMATEFVYRASAAGFYGAITQHIAPAQPRWLANATVVVGLPLISHLIEALIHYLRGTPNLAGGIAVSVAFTMISTMFNLHAMRQGALIVGEQGASIYTDLAAMPRILASFFGTGLMAVFRCVRKLLIPEWHPL